MINNLIVQGLNGRFNYKFQPFYEDLNLFTGHIGTGKTTLLELIWFLTSGNLQRVISEIPFDFVSIETSEFSLSMEHVTNPDQVKLVWSFTEAGGGSEALLDLKRGPSGFMVLEKEEKVGELNERIARVMKSSLFFPTFRRMERHLERDVPQGALFSTTLGDALSGLQDALSTLANELSVGDHKFIVAASTYDVIDLLTEKHIEINKSESLGNDEHETLVQRWSLLNELVKEIFEFYDGIRITEDIILGDDVSQARDLIPSSKLSSGEKQLLGFLCYNAFSKAKTIFIDEPELSLHPDWQRLLIALLEYQGTEKQFFLASHSPYIGMRYEDKEFRLERIS